MTKLKLVVLLVLIIHMMSTIAPGYARGEESRMKAVFMNTFYGMAAGALIATAVSLTQDNPDWGENVGTGAAIGGIAGALFGIATEVRYMASIEDGHIYASIPSLNVKMDRREGDGALYTTGIFQYRF